jgi:hypothetical protein
LRQSLDPITLKVIMRTVHLIKFGLIILLFLAIWNVGQAQDSLGMRCVSGLDYWSGAYDIQMVGDLVYVVGVSEMHIVSLADPENPEVIGRFTWYQWSGTSGGVYLIDTLAYLGTHYGGFVLDVSDPTNPVTLGQWSGTHMSDISFVHGNYAIAQSDEGFPFVLDVSDPTNVNRIGVFPPNAEAWNAAGMVGEYLCMTGFPGGLRLYDMSNPANPQCVASIDTTMLAHHAAISGNYAYMAGLYDGLRIIDFSNPLQPVEVAACDSIGRTEDVTVTGSHAVTTKYTATDAWLNIWNVADPTHPVFVVEIHPHVCGSSMIASSGNLICTPMTGSSDVLMVIDISNPAEPEMVSSFGPLGLLRLMAISGTTAYVGDRYTQLRTIDIADPQHVCELGHPNPSWADGLDIAVRGNYAYVVEQLDFSGTNGVVVFEVSNPAQPESLGCALYDGASRIVIEGDYAYVARLYHIATFSLANPAQPQCVNVVNIPLGNAGLGLASLNGYLYYGAGSSFYVCSLSNPAEPQITGSCNLGGGGWVFDLAAAGHYVYVARGFGGMRIVDVSNPANPTEVNWISGYWVGSVAATQNTVIMDDRTRISIYDVTNPLNPVLVGYYSTAEYIYDMEIQGQYLYTASAREFLVYECDALSGIEQNLEVVPHKFTLLPPYPNPFNSTLVIPFTLPIQSDATITIYNLLGQKVQQFGFPPLSPGAHRVVWDASSCASGTYIIQLISNGNELNQKALLLK